MDVKSYFESYSNGGITKGRLKEILMLWAYKQVNSFALINEDEKQELILSFYCKIDSYLENYNPEKKNFESYLSMNLQYSLLSLRSQNRRKNIQSVIATCGDYHLEKLSYGIALAESCYEKSSYTTCEENYNTIENYYSSSYPNLDEKLLSRESICQIKNEIQKYPISEIKRRHLLVQFLKQTNRLSPQQIETYCEIFDFNKEEIFHYIYKLQQLTSPKKERKNRYLEIMNNHFTALQILRYKHYNCEDNLVRKILSEKMVVLEERLKKATIRYHRCTVDPTNNELANVLSMPKGTVDSIFVTHPYNSLHFLKEFV